MFSSEWFTIYWKTFCVVCCLFSNFNFVNSMYLENVFDLQTFFVWKLKSFSDFCHYFKSIKSILYDDKLKKFIFRSNFFIFCLFLTAEKIICFYHLCNLMSFHTICLPLLAVSINVAVNRNLQLLLNKML